VTLWVGSGSLVIGDRANPKAWESYVLQNTEQHTGNDICTSREAVSGVTIDLQAAQLGGGVAGALSKVTGPMKKMAF
jgi:hypothetical protein